MKIPDSIRNLTSKEIFKIVLWCSGGFYVPLAIVLAFLALFGVIPANLNGQQYFGIKGFLIEILTVPIFTFLIAVSQWVILTLGLKILKWITKLFDRTSKAY